MYSMRVHDLLRCEIFTDAYIYVPHAYFDTSSLTGHACMFCISAELLSAVHVMHGLLLIQYILCMHSPKYVVWLSMNGTK